MLPMQLCLHCNSRVEIHGHGCGLVAHSRCFILQPAILALLVVPQRVSHRAVDRTGKACRQVGMGCSGGGSGCWLVLFAWGRSLQCDLEPEPCSSASVLPVCCLPSPIWLPALTHLSIWALILQSDPRAVALLAPVNHGELPPVPANLAAVREGCGQRNEALRPQRKYGKVLLTRGSPCRHSGPPKQAANHAARQPGCGATHPPCMVSLPALALVRYSTPSISN